MRSFFGMKNGVPFVWGDNVISHGIHAEVAAIELFLRKPYVKANKFDMIVIRVRRGNGMLAMSKPCCECTERIKRCRSYIRNVIYSLDESTLVCLPIAEFLHSMKSV